MSNTAIRLLSDPVLTLDFSDISGTYALVGALLHPTRIIHIQNLTDVTLMFSFDGINDNFPLVANGFLLLDVTTNKSLPEGCYLATGQRVYVKSIDTVPGMNAVYVSSFYGKPAIGE